MGDLKIVEKWRAIPDRVRETAERFSSGQSRLRFGADKMTMHELVHHIAEANLVAASMMTAAFGKSGATYDWSWLYPNMAWIERVGYANVPVEPAFKILEGLSEQIANLVTADLDLLECEITLFDTPDADRYKKTVASILRDEVEHAEMHLSEAIGFLASDGS